MTAATTIPTVGNWVEIIKPRKGRSYLPKGSTWLVEEVNTAKEAAKVSNGKTGEAYKFEHLYFDEISPSSQFKKGDIVQHDEDLRYIGRVTIPGSRCKVKWATGPEEYVSPSVLSLFVRSVKGAQQILGEYAFKSGDRVITTDTNHQGVTFTVRECYPSGMVGLTSETEHDISLPGCWLSLVGEPQQPDTEEDTTEPEAVTVTVEVIDASEFTETTSPCENFTSVQEPETVLAWIDPKVINTEAGTQTRILENRQQITLYAEKMATDEWEWEREPLPELVRDGEFYYVVSGYHRIKAALLANQQEDTQPVQVYCRVTPGTLADAKLAAIRSDTNDYHGVPESRADFRNRVEKFFNLLDKWDANTQVRELENLKSQPYASEVAVGIDLLIDRIKRGTSDGWSSRIIATYLKAPRSYRTINSLLDARKTASVFASAAARLSKGDWIQYIDPHGDTQIGQIEYISNHKITTKTLSGGFFHILPTSPLGVVRSIEKVEPIEGETRETEEETAPIVSANKVSGGGGSGTRNSISQELKKQAKDLGLPTSDKQVFPDSDRNQNSSPYDVDDRPFSTPAPTPQQLTNEYLIGFVSNTQNMTQPQIKRALEAVFEWMELHDKTQNLGYLKTVINDL